MGKKSRNRNRSQEAAVFIPGPEMPQSVEKSYNVGATSDVLGKALAGAYTSGGWISDHREEVRHFRLNNYVAVHQIGQQIAKANVTAFSDGLHQSSNQSRRKSLRRQYGSLSAYKSIYGQEDEATTDLPQDNPLMVLLKKPNPYESGYDFRYRQAIQLRLTGCIFVWNVPSMLGPTCQRYVIPTAAVTPMAPTPDMPYGSFLIQPYCSRYAPIMEDEGYVRGSPGWMQLLGRVVDARQIQKIGYPHPLWLDDYQSPIAAGDLWIDGEEAVNRSRTASVQNGINKTVVWELPPNVNPTQDIMDRTQAAIQKKHAGPNNAGGVLLAPNGTKITPTSSNPIDMCYAEAFQDSKGSVLALHSTPPVAVGYHEASSHAAWIVAMKQWDHTTIQPLCDKLAESDTTHLAPQFGEGITIEYEAESIQDEDMEAKDRQMMLQSNQLFRVDELRARFKMPPIGGTEGQKFYSAASKSPDKPGADASKPGDESNGFPKPPEAELPVDTPNPMEPETPFKRSEESQSKTLMAAIEGAKDADRELLMSKIDEIVEAKLKSLSGNIENAASKIATPSDSQKESGNYRKGHVTIQGMRVTIETAKGTSRSGIGHNGKPWSTTLQNHYGYLKGTQSGADGDHIDVFIGPHPESEIVFIIDQVNPLTGEFDEHKCMIGFLSTADAESAYLSNYSKGWNGLGAITPMTMIDFKKWIEEGDSSQAIQRMDLIRRQSVVERQLAHANGHSNGSNGKSLGMSNGVGADGGFTVKNEPANAYGKCPFCGSEVTMRERRIGGNDQCEQGHVYPSRMSILDRDPIEKKDENLPVVKTGVELESRASDGKWTSGGSSAPSHPIAEKPKETPTAAVPEKTSVKPSRESHEVSLIDAPTAWKSRVEHFEKQLASKSKDIQGQPNAQLANPEAMKEIKAGGIKLQYNPELSRGAAEFLASASRIKDLLPHASSVRLSKQENSQNSFYAARYGIPECKAQASANISTGEIIFYGGRTPDIETTLHEIGHLVARKIWNNISPGPGTEYHKAQSKEAPVTEYGKVHPAEDFAEAFAKYHRDKLAKNEGGLAKNFPLKHAAIANIMEHDLPNART